MKSRSKKRNGRPEREIKLPSTLSQFFLEGNKSLSRVAAKEAVNKSKTHLADSDAPKTIEERNAKIMAKIGITNMKPCNYLQSKHDQSHLVQVQPLEILHFVNGYGLFAAKDIPAETYIGEYTGERFTPKQFGNRPDHYVMKVDEDAPNPIIIDGAVKGNFTRYVNSSDSQANLEFVRLEDQDIVLFKTTRAIKQGEQFLADYNTLDDALAEECFFLNPSDNSLSTCEIYNANNEHYVDCTYHTDSPIFNIQQGEEYALTRITVSIINNEILSEQYIKVPAAIVNLPNIAIYKDNNLYDFNEKDTFSALMVASRKGQLANVAWLLEQGAHINQQQNISGLYPLSFALSGYANSKDKAANMSVILHLIRNGASVLMRDKRDITFLHKAINVMTDDHFHNVFRHVQAYRQQEFKELPDYIDVYSHDLPQACLCKRQFGKFFLFLNMYPEYMQQHMNNEEEQRKLKGIFNQFISNEKEKFTRMLSRSNHKIDGEILMDLGLIESKKRRVGKRQ